MISRISVRSFLMFWFQSFWRVGSVVLCCMGVVCVSIWDSAAQTAPERTVLPLPRFASLRSEQVNMRAGPGLRYPVDWVYMRRFLPVEIVSEYESWRKVRDPDGVEGWVHRSMISRHRTAVIRQAKVMLRRTADQEASPAAWLQEGVVVRVHQCPQASPFCRVEVESLHGWVLQGEIWGVYRDETFN